MMQTDRIEKTTVLRAPRSSVWQALSDSTRFGEWFGIQFCGRFEPGAHLEGKITQPGYRNLRTQITIDRVEPMRLLSWRWHPNAIDPTKDYSPEPTTLVVFELSDASGGTRLTVTESGFDSIPEERRQEARGNNDVGWTKEMDYITRYVSRAA